MYCTIGTIVSIHTYTIHYSLSWCAYTNMKNMCTESIIIITLYAQHTHTHTLVQHTHKHTQNQPAPQQFSVTYAGQRPPNQFVLSFLALCLCAWCWPALVFAILGIVYSIQVTTQCVSLSYSPQNIVFFFALK